MGKEKENRNGKTKGNAIALMPIGVFLVLYLGLGILFEYVMKIPMGFYNVPIVVAFLAAILVACLQNRAVNFEQKLEIMSGGVGDKNIITMLLIFLAAGSFVGVVGRGSAESVAYCMLSLIPARYAVAVLFVVSCFVSVAMGTSVGTITLLVPIASAVSGASGFELAFCVVVKAFEKIPDQKLIVAGDGPMMAEMKAYIKDHNMSNVKFAGYLDKAKVQEKYRGAKAVIMASQCYEAFAMTIAEAYSNAVPVIAGNVGNLANMVEEGVTGIKFIYDSPDDLAAKILKYNTMDIAKMKQNAKTFYEKRLKPEDNYRILEEIYHKIM